MTPQMGVATAVEIAAAVAAEAAIRLAADIAEAAARLAADNAHAALTVGHGTVDDIADQTDIENHRLDADAHHSEEIPEGRPFYAGLYGLVLPGVSFHSVTTHAVSADDILYFPIKVKTPITIDQFVFEVTIAAGAGEKIRAGIYRADINWQPLDLVVATPEMAIDAVAVVTQAIADTVLQEGRYLIAMVAEGACTLRTILASSPFNAAKIQLIAAMNIYMWWANVAYAALPDPGTVWDTVAGGVSHIYYKMFFRIATP